MWWLPIQTAAVIAALQRLMDWNLARVAHSLRDALVEESRRRTGDVVELVEESTAHLAVSARDFDGVQEEADAVVELPEAFDLGDFPVFGTRSHGTAFTCGCRQSKSSPPSRRKTRKKESVR